MYSVCHFVDRSKRVGLSSAGWLLLAFTVLTSNATEPTQDSTSPAKSLPAPAAPPTKSEPAQNGTLPMGIPPKRPSEEDLFGDPKPNPRPASASGTPKKQTLDEYVRTRVEFYRDQPERTNGVRLRATAEVRSFHSRTQLLIHWALDYVGPRQPLIILRPALDVPIGSHQCRVIIYGFWNDPDDQKRENVFPIHPRGPMPKEFNARVVGPYYGEEAFLTVPRDTVSRGTLAIDAVQIRDVVRAKLSIRSPPSHVFVQLEHDPKDRGEKYEIDAWTGFTRTELMVVPWRDLGLFSREAEKQD